MSLGKTWLLIHQWRATVCHSSQTWKAVCAFFGKPFGVFLELQELGTASVGRCHIQDIVAQKTAGQLPCIQAGAVGLVYAHLHLCILSTSETKKDQKRRQPCGEAHSKNRMAES